MGVAIVPEVTDILLDDGRHDDAVFVPVAIEKDGYKFIFINVLLMSPS